MGRPKKAAALDRKSDLADKIAEDTKKRAAGVISLSHIVRRKQEFEMFSIWIIGETPLISHAWNHKGKEGLLKKQTKEVKTGREKRDPDGDFRGSLYEMKEGSGVFGFPVTAFKNAILSAAHKDKGIARVGARSALHFDADMVRVMPAFVGAICDMPLVRIYGDEPMMREDMVKIGSGLNKTATLAYRAQFTNWAVNLTGKVNPKVLTLDALVFLIDEAGTSTGVGEWRPEKNGIFGCFHAANVEEEADWIKFRDGKGKVPGADLPMAAE